MSAGARACPPMCCYFPGASPELLCGENGEWEGHDFQSCRKPRKELAALATEGRDSTPSRELLQAPSRESSRCLGEPTEAGGLDGNVLLDVSRGCFFSRFPLRARAACSKLCRMFRHSLRSLLHDHRKFPGRTSHSERRSGGHSLLFCKASLQTFMRRAARYFGVPASLVVSYQRCCFPERQAASPADPWASRPRLAGASVITSGPLALPVMVGLLGMVS